MNAEFVQEILEEAAEPLTGWETIVFELEDDPDYDGFSVLSTAAIAPWKPILECVPSQNGFVVDPPQRQSAAFFTGTSLPCASTSRNSPSTTYGPLSLILMVMAISTQKIGFCASWWICH